jgi:formylglycine-generating enzyme
MRSGDPDERPSHPVMIAKPFHMAATEVTNRQFEQFDPAHRYLRGKLGFSIDDDEAVVFVSWHDATAFAEWLSEREGLPYRLPTEAEWEYAARAGTMTPFSTGRELPEEFHKNVGRSWLPDPRRGRGREEMVPLNVGRTPANPWGLFDMHGNVEEWCLDWYGPYEPGPQTDPPGRASGDFKVTRGGSHSTELYYLRSGNRMGLIPEGRNWLVGFRLVVGELPGTEPTPPPPPPLHQRNVRRDIPADLDGAPDPDTPYFMGPTEYVKIREGSSGPIFSHHNHVPSLVALANGDLLAIWYTCVTESGRELAVVASRLRYGAEAWDPADMFWDQPDRNEHTPALWVDERGTIFHFNGYSVAATWGGLAVVLRKSDDHGATWGKAQLIVPEHHFRQMPVQSIFRTLDDRILLPCDRLLAPDRTAIYLSSDEGRTWTDPGGQIAGIHAAVAQLKDGRLLAFGRGDNIDGRMPMSMSADMGRNWTYAASPFPPIGGGHRPVLLRLREGPLMLVSFTGPRREQVFMEITDGSGRRREVTGMYAAVSHDEGETWFNVRLVSDDGPDRTFPSMDRIPFTMGFSSAEPAGYNAVVQTPNGLIHLITSRNHYVFNLNWLETAPPERPTVSSDGEALGRSE